jgi:hypothetical protein
LLRKITELVIIELTLKEVIKETEHAEEYKEPVKEKKAWQATAAQEKGGLSKEAGAMNEE